LPEVHDPLRSLAPDAWPEVSGVPRLAETLVAHAGLADSVEAVEASLEEGNRTRLY
jgi:hypothetical protein